MSSTKKNIIYNTAYQLLAICLPLITSPYLSRILGAEGIGIYSYTYSIANYFVLFAMLGINNYGNRSIAMVKDDETKRSKTFFSIYAMQAITAVIAFAVYIIYIAFFVSQYKAIAIIQSIYVLSALFDINWFFFGMGKFKITVTRNSIIKILTVVLIFTIVKDANDLWKYALIITVGTFISQTVVWIYLKRYIRFYKIKISDIKQHIKPNLILFIPAISYSIYKIMDKIMLGNLTTVTEVGLYENAEKIINIPQGIITAIGTVMLSRMSNMAVTETKEKNKMYIELSMKYVSIIACAIMFGLMAIGQRFAPIYFGDEFTKTGNIIVLMSCIVLFISWANVIRTQFLIPNKKDKIYVVSTLVGALINLILNLLLISRLQSYGAAIGTIFAEFSVMFIQLILVKKELNIKQFFKDLICPFLSGLVMFIIVRIIGNIMEQTIISLVIQIIIGAIIYIVAVGAYLMYTKDQIFCEIIESVKLKIKNN